MNASVIDHLHAYNTDHINPFSDNNMSAQKHRSQVCIILQTTWHSADRVNSSETEETGTTNTDQPLLL